MTVEEGVPPSEDTVERDESATTADPEASEAPSPSQLDETVPPASSTPTKSEIFDLVSNHRRRYTIHFCKEHEGPVELSNLAEYVAARELDKDVTELTSNERKRVYTSLQQTHLPRLERAGMITDDNGTIELTDRISELEIYLDIVPENSVPWGVYYLGLTTISALTLGLLYADVLPTETISHLGWATLIVAAFMASAIVHTLQNRKYRLDWLDMSSE